MAEAPATVVELPNFLREADRHFSEEERMQLVDFVAAMPESGDLIPGTGGLRKLRWGVQGRGKRGGVRVIYYYHSPAMPIFLLNVFAKNEKSDLKATEKNLLRTLVSTLVSMYQKGRK